MLRRKAPGLTPRGEEARTKKRLTEELDEWITHDSSGLSIEQARMLSLVETAEKAFTPTSMSPQEAERLATELQDDALVARGGAWEPWLRAGLDHRSD